MTRPMTPGSDLMPGDLRLLNDLAVLQRALDPDRVQARDRLDRELGAGLAEFVRRSLLETTARAA
jgi:hypothetical protein